MVKEKKYQGLSDMDMVYNIGQMELAMKVFGNLIKHRGKEHLNINKVTYTMEILKTTWLMDTVNTFMLMVQHIRENS